MTTDGYLGLARKYRPQGFGDLVGQGHVVQTLRNALSTDRVAQAYLFAGPRGVGKTTTARLLAKSLNCLRGPTPDPCNDCDPCREIAGGSSLDVMEMDAASNRGIDEIRDLRERVGLVPAGGRRAVYIIDEVHQLTGFSFDALLKTLEEPPPHAVFILATTEPHEVPATIHSRCQRFMFRLIEPEEVARRLGDVATKEGLEVEPAALEKIALAGQGSLRDSLMVLDQVAARVAARHGAQAAGDRARILAAAVEDVLGLLPTDTADRMVERLADGDAGGCLAVLDRLVTEGYDPMQVARDLRDHIRSLFRFGLGGEAALPDIVRARRTQLAAQSAQLGPARLAAALEALSDSVEEMRRSDFPRIVLEVALVKIAGTGSGGVREASVPKLAAAPATPPVTPPRPSPPAPAQSAGPPPAPKTAPEGGDWPRIVHEVEKRAPAVAMALKDVTAALQGAELSLTVTGKFNHSLLESKRDVITAAARTVLGRPVTVKCSLGTVNSAPPAAAARPAVAEDDEAAGGADDPGTTFVEEADESTPASRKTERSGAPSPARHPTAKSGSPGGTVVQKIAELFGGQIESGPGGEARHGGQGAS